MKAIKSFFRIIKLTTYTIIGTVGLIAAANFARTHGIKLEDYAAKVSEEDLSIWVGGIVFFILFLIGCKILNWMLSGLGSAVSNVKVSKPAKRTRTITPTNATETWVAAPKKEEKVDSPMGFFDATIYDRHGRVYANKVRVHAHHRLDAEMRISNDPMWRNVLVGGGSVKITSA